MSQTRVTPARTERAARQASEPRSRTARPATARTTDRTATPRTTARTATARTTASAVTGVRRAQAPRTAQAAGVHPGQTRAPARRAPLAAQAPRTAHPRRRALVILIGVVLVLLAFVARLVWVQGLDTAALASEAFDNRLRTVVLPAERGQILDAEGVVLATSVERWTVIANQEQLADWGDGRDSAVEAARLLGPLLGLPVPELGADLVGDDPYVVLARDVSPEVYEQVVDLEIAGIGGERSTRRDYPAGTTAGNLIGFVGAEGFGQAGIEQVYDDVLAGEDGSETYEQGAAGQRIPTGQDDLAPATDGRDVQLTIERDLQYMAQAAIDDAVRTHGAEWGTVEVLDVVTGEILALADSGTIDPNDPDNADASRAAAVVYEPGSTAKVITMAAILEQGVASPTTPFVVPDTYAVPNGESFRDSHPHEPLNLTLTGILAESSNTGTVMVGQNLPKAVRHDYLVKFGLGSLTGVGLPGESAGLLWPADAWDGRSEYAVLFGQAVSVTTLQATQVFATVANGGVRVPSHLVAAVQDETGAMVPVTRPEPVQVVSPQTADTLMAMLESVVTEGTGGRAAVAGYRIAGKTGTSQAFEGGGVVKNVASFIGIAPADDPRIVVNVALYDPKTSIYGGDVAAPVFSQVAGQALQYLGVPPSGTTPTLFATTWQ